MAAGMRRHSLAAGQAPAGSCRRAVSRKSSHSPPRKRAGAKVQSASFGGAFAGTIMCKSSFNAAYSAIMFNAGTVNSGRACPERADFCEDLLGKSEFLSSKTPFKYNRRFDNNHKFWRRCGKLSLYINGVAIRGAIRAKYRCAKSGSKSVSAAAKSAGTSLREVEICLQGPQRLRTAPRKRAVRGDALDGGRKRAFPCGVVLLPAGLQPR